MERWFWEGEEVKALADPISYDLPALRALLPVLAGDTEVIRDPGVLTELDAYRSGTGRGSRQDHHIVRLYLGNHSGEFFKVKEVLHGV